MDIAIIGGGASGMATAYFLSKQGHNVVVYEKQSVLGGNIRTLNKNVPFQGADSKLTLEAGVLEFPDVFHNFIALMNELDIELNPVDLGSAVFLKDGQHILSSTMIKQNARGIHRLFEYLHLTEVYATSAKLLFKTQLSQFRDKPMADYCTQNNIAEGWLKSLIMYSYSMPFSTIGKVPAELAIPAIKQYMMADWVSIKGGVYSYIEKILSLINGEVILNAQVSSISRINNRVQVKCSDQSMREFDKIVFATQPDQVLSLLADSSDEERLRFSAWHPNEMKTIIHTDTSIYARYGIQQASEFDFFETEDGWGYNCLLNQLCGLPKSPAYGLAYNLENLIDPNSILHTESHRTPFYTVDALHHRGKIKETNGDQNTYHAGAYLYDGLHEGAITSALSVAKYIG